MKMNIKVNINVCRVCLQSESGLSIFAHKVLQQQFNIVTQLQAAKGDGLPETLCGKCVKRLRAAFDFRKQSELSERHLRKFILQVNDKFNQSIGTNDSQDDDLNITLTESSYELNKKPESNKSKIQKEIKQECVDYFEPEEIIIEQDEVQQDEDEDQEEEYVEEQQQQQIQEDKDEREKEQYDEEREIIISMIQNRDDIDGIQMMTDDDDPIGEHQEIDETEHGTEEEEEEEEEMEQYIIGSDAGDENSEIQYENDESMEEEHLSENFTIETIDTEQSDIKNDIKIQSDSKSPKTTKNRRTKKSSTSRSSLHICGRCNRDFSSKTNLHRHMMSHDGNKPFTCTICGAGFTQNGSLKQHMHIHTGERPFKCDVCDKGFTQAKTLVFHRRRHTGEKPFQCLECGMQFRQRDGLKRHEQVKHTTQEKENHPCEICHKVLRSKYSLNFHMKKHANSNIKEEQKEDYTCNICHRIFSSKQSLQIHSARHDEKDRIPCQMCEKKFLNKSLWMAHMKEHKVGKQEHGGGSGDGSSGDTNRYQCVVCNEMFATEKEIQEHLSQHTESTAEERKKRLKCPKCPKYFSIVQNLITHLRNHSNETILYKCDECDIAFDNQRSYKLHRSNQHKEFVPTLNECPICSITFIAAADLNTHMMMEHDEIEEKCVECDLVIYSKSDYDQHMLEHEIHSIVE